MAESNLVKKIFYITPEQERLLEIFMQGEDYEGRGANAKLMRDALACYIRSFTDDDGKPKYEWIENMPNPGSLANRLKDK